MQVFTFVRHFNENGVVTVTSDDFTVLPDISRNSNATAINDQLKVLLVTFDTFRGT